MSNNTYLKYSHKNKRWERRYSRSRGYRSGYVTYPQGGRRGGRSMAGLLGAIVILLFIALNVYSYLIWYLR